MEPVVRTEKLGFWYGRVLALADLDLEIPPGITAVLGPNGSGKTTMLRLLAGFLPPIAGRLDVLGESPWNNPRLAPRIGYAPETDTMDAGTSARGFVRFALAMKGIGGAEAEKKVRRALERTDALEFADRPVRTLSRGMRQRIKIAAALAHDPELLVLDEPFTGVDPVIRKKLIDLFGSIEKEGRSILVSSHVLSEVEALTRRIVLLHRGRLLAEGEVAEIRGLIDRHPHQVRVRAECVRGLAAALARAEEVDSIDFDRDTAVFHTRRPAAFYARLTRTVAEGGFGLQELVCPDDNLEAVFRYLTRP